MNSLVDVNGNVLTREKGNLKFKGLKITPIGELQVWLKDGVHYSVEPEGVPLFASHKKPSEDILESMHILFECIGEVLKMSKRAIPVTRKELQNNGISKKKVKNLARIGLVRNISITTSKIEEGKVANGPSVNVVYPTPQGKAFFKEFFGEEKAVSVDNPSSVHSVPASAPVSLQEGTSSGK